jgi:hypothetical protein
MNFRRARTLALHFSRYLATAAAILALVRDSRSALKRYKFLTKAARLSSSSLIASFISFRLWSGPNSVSAI